MKIFGRGSVAFGVLFALAVPGAYSGDPRTVSVSGEAEVKVVPDQVTLNLGVETWDRNLTLAKKQNDDRVRAVLAASKGLGVDAKNTQTDFISVETTYDGSRGRNILTGYFVRKSIVITLKETARFEALLSATLEAGANHLHGVDFRTSELRKYRDQARALAIKAAKEKATALAKELGQSIGKPQSIQENGSWWYSSHSSGWVPRYGGMMQVQNASVGGGGRGDPSSEDSTVALGQISVRAGTQVTFILE